MAIHYPELLYPAIVALVCVLWVVPWHIRTRNMATLAMAFWMSTLSLTNIVNSEWRRMSKGKETGICKLMGVIDGCIAALWNVGAEDKAPVWCDISESFAKHSPVATVNRRFLTSIRLPFVILPSPPGVTFRVGYNFGLPLAHLMLARQLESLTTLRGRSVLFDAPLKKRKHIVDCVFAFVGPVVGILLHLSTQDRRYYIIEGTGCYPATYFNGWGLLVMAIVPICIALAAGTYTSEQSLYVS
jgi:pheromone a factor receptor